MKKEKLFLKLLLAVMWVTVFVLWVRCAPAGHPKFVQLMIALGASIIAGFSTWAISALVEKIKSLEYESTSKDSEISDLKRFEKISETKRLSMIAFLNEKFSSKVSKEDVDCNGFGCFQNQEWGRCSHGTHYETRTILRVTTKDGGKIVLAPEKEDAIFNHVKDVPGVVDVEVSCEILVKYSYEI